MNYLLVEKDLTFQIDFDLDNFPKIRYSSRSIIYVAFSLALSIHLVFLWFIFSSKYNPQIRTTHPTSVEITLIKHPDRDAAGVQVQETIQKSNPKPDQLVQEKTNKSVKSSSVILSQKQVEQEAVSLAKPIELLSTEDYQELSKETDQLNSQDVLVFNPGLKKLRDETRRTTTKNNTTSDLSWQDTAGNLYYKAGGNCFMSPPQSVPSAVTGGKNWYLISCPGKTESEQMMENVNREMRERFGHK